MSNLIKYAYFNMNGQDKRVIDSDSRKEEFPELYSNPKKYSGEFKGFKFADLTEEEEINAVLQEPAEEFTEGLNVISMEQIVDEEMQKVSGAAHEEAEEIINAARRQADRIIEEANSQADDIRKQAFEEGKLQGIEEGNTQVLYEIGQKKEELDNEFNEKLQQLMQYQESIEPRFADIMIALIGKITGVLCEDKKDIIVYLIDNAVNNLEKTKSINLRVSKADMPVVSANKALFMTKAAPGVELDIIEDSSLEQNQCIIETDNKIIDCGLDTQISNLCEQIKMLSI